MEEGSVKISCAIFQKQEQEVKALTDKINKAKGVSEKARYAGELQEEVNILLNCDGYSEARLDCKTCHTIANLRKATAGVIIKAKKLV